MEPVALRIQPPQQFDPFGAAQKGIQLGQMGLQVEQLRQGLIQQKLAEEQTRQSIETQAIEQRQKQLTLDRDTRQEFARTTIAALKPQFVKTDKAGNKTVDYDGLYIAAAEKGVDTSTMNDIIQKGLATKSAQIKTAGEANVALDNFITTLARGNANVTDPAKVAQNFQSGATYFSSAFGIPKEVVEERMRTTLGWQPDATGAPPDLTASIRGYLQGKDITEAEQREAEARGEGRSAFDPNSAQSKAMRDFLKRQGVKVAPNATLADMRVNPETATAVKANEARVLADIIPAEVKATGLGEAGEARIALGVYENARGALAQLKKELGTRLGSMTQAAIAQLVKQDPRYAAVNDAINDYNQRNKTDISIARDGLEPVMERILRQQDTLVRTVREGAKKAQAGSFRQAGEEKMPTTPPKAPAGTVLMTHPRHQGAPVPVPQREVEEAKKAGWRPV